MRLPKISLWSPDSKFDGLILFAQLLEEMLYDYTIDSYKTPFSNSNSLLLEITDTIFEERDRNKDLKNSDNVKLLRDELLNKISHDPIAIKILNSYGENNCKTLLTTIKNAKNFSELLTLIEPIKFLFENNNHYFETTKTELYTVISDPDANKQMIVALTKNFISELISKGFSQQYIYHKTEDYFFGDLPHFIKFSDINEYLTEFFNFFKLEEHEWDIIARGTDTFEKIIPLFERKNPEITITQPKNRTDEVDETRFLNGTYHGLKAGYPYFIIFKKVQAFDFNSAKQYVEQYLNLLNSYIKFTAHHLELDWDPIMLVYSENNLPELSIPPVSPLARIPRFRQFFRYERKTLTPDEISKMLTEHLPRLSIILDDDAKYSINKSMTFHNAATRSKDIENQFLNIWIALETLVPISPEDTIFLKFKSSFEPILSTAYCEKLISDFHHNLSFYFNRDLSILFSLLPPECSEFNELEKCASIILSNDEEITQLLFEKIGRNPLFFLRLQELQYKFSSGEQIKKEISQHQNRIFWHLQRMYRVRNKITHKGERIKNINYLTENMNSYYHTIIDHLDACASDFEHLNNVDAIFAFCNINLITYQSLLESSKNQSCDNSNLGILLFDT